MLKNATKMAKISTDFRKSSGKIVIREWEFEGRSTVGGKLVGAWEYDPTPDITAIELSEVMVFMVMAMAQSASISGSTVVSDRFAKLSSGARRHFVQIN